MERWKVKNKNGAGKEEEEEQHVARGGGLESK